ncbi:PREDICTED: uncharacterized protein LOC106814969 [Priapulus caudatus]|uniref:Uncharacterized protein LOC106814969 n=1 Tax=Priapulus caudatus TaxID=37621 RepID=A0ABM1ERN1_PRICU|nr:PREDICTED: uncharacterized protein LOC106814969 [Priapulus caudatus]
MSTPTIKQEPACVDVAGGDAATTTRGEGADGEIVPAPPLVREFSTELDGSGNAFYTCEFCLVIYTSFWAYDEHRTSCPAVAAAAALPVAAATSPDCVVVEPDSGLDFYFRCIPCSECFFTQESFVDHCRRTHCRLLVTQGSAAPGADAAAAAAGMTSLHSDLLVSCRCTACGDCFYTEATFCLHTVAIHCKVLVCQGQNSAARKPPPRDPVTPAARRPDPPLFRDGDDAAPSRPGVTTDDEPGESTLAVQPPQARRPPNKRQRRSVGSPDVAKEEETGGAGGTARSKSALCCGARRETFGDSSSLQRHLLAHAKVGEDRTFASCGDGKLGDDDDDVIVTREALKFHWGENQFTNQRGGVFTCAHGVCGAQFSSPSKLAEHSYLHISPKKDAIRCLNSLQTNAETLARIRKEGGRDVQRNIPDMITFAQRAGITLDALDKLNVIHVSGTKGKGSTCAFTESILRQYGYKTGLFTSPHLVETRERIRINGLPIEKKLFASYFFEVYNRLINTKNQHDPEVGMPAYFRFLTLMSLYVFVEQKVDVAILECGIGGTYDCTNIVRKPVVCGVSSLGIDHVSLLGDTVEKIAWHKAGIFKVRRATHVSWRGVAWRGVVCRGVSSLGIDHVSLLGDTVEKIAWHKAGIFKSQGDRSN